VYLLFLRVEKHMKASLLLIRSIRAYQVDFEMGITKKNFGDGGGGNFNNRKRNT
jgi:hypothetical protein